MKVAVMGAGALGCYFGGMLARAGHQVTLIGRPVQAIAQQPFGPLLRTEGVDALMRDIVGECLAVARATGIDIPGDPWQALRRTGSQSGQYSSMAQDLARGRRTEIDHLNGHVVRQGEALGVATPVNRCVQWVVRQLEIRGG